MTGAVRVLVGNRLRRRWMSVLVVALTTAVAGTVTLAALAGARRTSTSVARALDDARVADVSVDVGVVDKGHLAQVARLPEVAAVSTYLYTAIRPAGTKLVPGLELTGFTPVDDAALMTMDAPRYRSGRAPRPERTDEIAINSDLARHLHLVVGDALTVETYRQDQVDSIFSGTAEVTPAGARIRATITGIADPLDAFASAGGNGGQGGFGIIQLTHAAWVAHGAPLPLDYTADPPPNPDLGVFRLLLRAHLVHGAADAPRYLRDVFRIYGDAAETTFSEARPEVFRAAGDSVRVQSIALLLFGLAAALAGVVGAGQASARDAVDAADTDDAQLRAMGLSRRERVLAAALPGVAGVGFGVVLAVIGATVTSRWLPRGLGARFEPHPGTAFNAAVLLPGAAVLALLIGGRALVAAWRATAATRRVAVEPGHLTRLTSGLPPAASMGARLALSRRTLVAAIAAVTGVVGALTFGTSLDHLARTPRLSGEPWDTQVIFQSDGESLSAREAPRLAKDERVGALSQYGLFEARLRTDHRVQGMAVDRLKGEVAPTVVKGRLPNSQDEIAVDPGTVPGPGPRIGATLRVQAGGDPQRMTVVGTLTGTGAGFVVTSAAAKRLAADIADAGFLLAWRPGVDTAAAVRDLHKTFADVEGPVTADRVANIDDARGFPYALSLFLGLLGLLATGHLLMTTVRRRRLDLAVARALGFTLGQARAVAAWQATTVAAVAVVAGVPLGLAVGRWAWAAVTGALRVVDESPTPVLATALAAAAALVLANALAALPALRAGRIRPADVLRAE